MALAKGCESDIAFTTRPEADTGRADEVSLVEKGLKELPTTHAIGRLEPDVRGIVPTVGGKSGLGKCLQHEPGVGHVVLDGLLYLSTSLGGIGGCCTALGNVACTIVLGALAARPQLVEADGLAIGIGLEGLGDNRIAATGAGEAGSLGVAVKLDGALLGSLYLVDGVGYLWIRYIGLIGGIVHDEASPAAGVVDPLLQLLTGDDSTCRIVGVAAVDDVDLMVGNLGGEVIGGCTGHVGDAVPQALGSERAGASAHDIGVDVDGIDGVSDADGAVATEYVANISGVALGAVADKDFVNVHLNAARTEVSVDDGLPQKLVSLLGTIAAEGLLVPHLLNGLVHGLYDGWSQGLRDVTDAEADDVCFWMTGLEGFYLVGDVAKEVVAL